MKSKDQKIFLEALNELEKEKGIKKEELLVAIETALIAAFKKNYGDSENVEIEINRETGEVKVLSNKMVVENVEDKYTEISLEDAKDFKKRAKIGDIIAFEINAETFKRNAIQNAKQIVIQKVREYEKQNIYNKFKNIENTIISALVKKTDDNGNIYVEINGLEAIIPYKELLDDDVFVQGDRVTIYVGAVEEGTKYTKTFLSRRVDQLVIKLFEREIPEIAEGVVEIKAIAREAGSRTKIAISTEDPNIDLKGVCIGENNIRIHKILKELNGEKIDLIEWDNDIRYFVKNALSPAEIFAIEILKNDKDVVANVEVDETQLSMAIGKKGQNTRLASKLCKLRINVVAKSKEEQLDEINDESLEQGE